MILKDEFNLLVIVGGWNCYIFNKEWIGRFLLPKEKLEMELSLEGSQRISSENVRIELQKNRLNFIPRNNKTQTYELIEELAVKVADYLPHTPVTSCGVNFVFETESDEFLNGLLKTDDNKRLSDFGANIIKNQLRHRITVDELDLIITISENDSKLHFDFNFHFDIENLTAFKDKIADNNVLKLKQRAVDLMKNVYRAELL